MAVKKAAEVKVEETQLCDYDLVFIVNPEVVDEALETAVANISQFITSKGGVISNLERWGKKRLAYPIKHFLEGHYVLAQFKLGPSRSRELEKNLEISENVLRHLLVRVSD